MDEDDPRQQQKKEIAELKQKIANQDALLNRHILWEGDQLYKQLEQLEHKRIEKQNQYKILMKERYRFAKSTWLQGYIDNFLDQKLNRNIEALGQEIDSIVYSRNSKSSISSSGALDHIESMDWLLNDKAEKHLRQQEKVLQEIKQLQKILDSIK